MDATAKKELHEYSPADIVGELKTVGDLQNALNNLQRYSKMLHYKPLPKQLKENIEAAVTVHNKNKLNEISKQWKDYASPYKFKHYVKRILANVIPLILTGFTFHILYWIVDAAVSLFTNYKFHFDWTMNFTSMQQEQTFFSAVNLFSKTKKEVADNAPDPDAGDGVKP